MVVGGVAVDVARYTGGDGFGADTAQGYISDSQLLPALLTQINADIAQVSGDGAYDTGACYAAISARKPRRRFRQDVVHVSGATAIQMTRRDAR